jgi:hypothetical protein
MIVGRRTVIGSILQIIGELPVPLDFSADAGA